MLSEEVRARLEQLNRGRLPELPVSVAPSPLHALAPPAIGEATEVPALLPRRVAPADPSDVTLASLVPGEEVCGPLGVHYAVRASLDVFWAEFPVLLRRLSARAVLPERRGSVRQLAEAFPGKTLFLDLETCGLAGAPIFLVGLIRSTPDGLLLDQLLARNYAEEQAILATLEENVRACEVLVTFNGRTFDWPMVRDRRAYHRLPDVPSMLPHVDLLIHARRAWRRQVPNCRLQTLERFLCRRTRQGDIPGSQIPAAYHAFVRTGDARQLRDILHHNALDLVTLAQLTMRMLGEAGVK